MVLIRTCCRIRRLDEVTTENYELRVLLEQAEANLKAERAQRQSIVDYYKKFLAKSDASKKKHDTAVEEYHKYQLAQLQDKVRVLEVAAAAVRKETESSAESDAEEEEEEEDDDEEDEDEDEPSPQNHKLQRRLCQQPQDVVDLDSDE